MLVRSLMLMGVLITLVVGSHLLPDPCVCGDDDCCTESACTADCGTPCCAGIPATPEVAFQLDLPVVQEPTFECLIDTPDFLPPDPLVRPPIAA